MNRQRKRQRIIAIIVASVLALSIFVSLLLTIIEAGSAAASATQSEIDALTSQADELEAKQNELSTVISSAEFQKKTALEKKMELDQQIILTQKEIANLGQQIVLYEKVIEEKRLDRVEAALAEAEQYDIFKKRVRAMEESGTISYMEVLFQAESFSDLLSSLDFISNIMEYDNKVAADLEAARAEVEMITSQLEESRGSSDKAKIELVDKEALLEQQVSEAEQVIAEISNDLAEYRAYYNELDAEREVIDKEISELEEKLRKEVEAENARLAAQAAGGGNTPYIGNGSYVWPCPSSYNVTSDFGTRLHPIQQVYKTHYGTDIAASSGSSVIAADSGQVILAQYYGSYGNLIIVSHGDGKTTRYAHLSGYNVSVGDYVSQGSVIGYVGSTGASTGPHLHFEIRINGTAVNPMDYFS